MKEQQLIKQKLRTSSRPLVLLTRLKEDCTSGAISGKASSRIRDNFRPEKFIKTLENISPREKEVLFLVAQEFTINEIALALFISPHTAVSHRKNLMRKWDVKNTAGLVRKGFELGILTI